MLIQETIVIPIAPTELSILNKLGCNYDVARELSESTKGGTLTIKRADARRISESLTELLARVGFDEDYVLTPEGHMIERLIDHMIEP